MDLTERNQVICSEWKVCQNQNKKKGGARNGIVLTWVKNVRVPSLKGIRTEEVEIDQD